MSHIHLTTTKVSFKSLVFDNSLLSDSLYIKSLTSKGKEFCFSTAKPKKYDIGETITPEKDFGKIFYMISGEIYIIYKRKSDGFQKLIKTLRAGDFFAMRQDFKNLYFYTKTASLTFFIENNDVTTSFSLSPESRRLVFEFFKEMARSLDSLNNDSGLELLQ
jgi:CRP-like cAMP-binding protein